MSKILFFWEIFLKFAYPKWSAVVNVSDTAVAQNLVKNVQGDFIMIPNPGQKKIVRFQPQETRGLCEVTIIDDSSYEADPEEFHVTVASESELYYIDPVNQDCLIRILPDPQDRQLILHKLFKI